MNEFEVFDVISSQASAWLRQGQTPTAVELGRAQVVALTKAGQDRDLHQKLR